MNDINKSAVFPALAGAAPSANVELEETRVPLVRQYVLVAMRWKRTIFAITAAFLLGGLVITFLMTPQYTAVTRLEIAREANRVAPVQGVERETTDADLEFYQTQYGLLQSRSLAEQVADQLKLTDDPAFFKLFKKRPQGVTGAEFTDQPLPAASRVQRRQQVADLLLLYIRVDPVRLSRLVDISFTSPDAVFSQRVANAWAASFIRITLDRRYEATAYARQVLESRLNDLRQKLETSEREAVNFASQQQIIDIPIAGGANGGTAERSIIAENLAALNNQLNLAIADRVQAQARLSGSEQGAFPEALQNTAISGLRQKRAELSAEYQKLLVQFEPEYPTARALKSQIDQLDRSIKREEGRVFSSIQNTYRDSVAREQALKSDVDRLKASLLDMRRRSIQYGIYQREADTNRQLYDALLQRYKEIGVAGGVGVNNISVVDTAALPDRPSSPRLFFNIVLALVAGFAASAGAVFVLEQTSESFDDPGELAKILRVPLLGTIPVVDGYETPLQALNDRKSHLVEAFLSVEANLRFSTSHGVPRSISVTSTQPAEGKSTTSLAIATLLARIGKRVILIDGDMRSPSMHDLMGVQNDRGLSDYLAGNDAIETLMRQSGTGLTFVTAGPPPPNAAELLNGDRLRRLVAKLEENFDHIVIDSPPVMGLADAPLIGTCVEGTVFAVESHGVRSSLARVAVNRLKSAKVNVLGAILTKFEAKRAHYGYGYQYGYNYGPTNAKQPTG
ncbi:MAG: polysaccharide biosynthesis tyrosine autokinase [Sphingomonas sp.]